METAAGKKVEELIAQNLIVVFSKSYCPHCKKALETIKETGVACTAVELDIDPEGDAIHTYLKEKTKQNTVPNIFIKQKHIGGNSDLQSLKTKGELEKMLQ